VAPSVGVPSLRIEQRPAASSALWLGHGSAAAFCRWRRGWAALGRRRRRAAGGFGPLYKGRGRGHACPGRRRRPLPRPAAGGGRLGRAFGLGPVR
jgi:hypothetical protein